MCSASKIQQPFICKLILILLFSRIFMNCIKKFITHHCICVAFGDAHVQSVWFSGILPENLTEMIKRATHVICLTSHVYACSFLPHWCVAHACGKISCRNFSKIFFGFAFFPAVLLTPSNVVEFVLLCYIHGHHLRIVFFLSAF